MRIELRIFVALLFAVLVGAATAVLTHMSGQGTPQSLIVGGGAFGAAFLWVGSVIK